MLQDTLRQLLFVMRKIIQRADIKADSGGIAFLYNGG